MPDEKPTTPTTTPAAPAAPALPKTPGEVKRTPIKHPQIIAMEKKLSEQQDEIDGLKGWKDEVNSVLEGINVGAPSGQTPPSKIKIPVTDPNTPAPKKGWLAEVNDDITKLLGGNS